jgi:hypothetical protein
MSTMRRVLAVMVTTTMMSTALVVGSTGTAQAVTSKWYDWVDVYSGDCTMSDATWFLRSDGTASFDATVSSSDDDDAWLMWLKLKDANDAVIGYMTNANIQDSDDGGKFIQNLHDYKHRWLTSGRFPAEWFDLIDHVELVSHC